MYIYSVCVGLTPFFICLAACSLLGAALAECHLSDGAGRGHRGRLRRHRVHALPVSATYILLLATRAFSQLD